MLVGTGQDLTSRGASQTTETELERGLRYAVYSESSIGICTLLDSNRSYVRLCTRLHTCILQLQHDKRDMYVHVDAGI